MRLNQCLRIMAWVLILFASFSNAQQWQIIDGMSDTNELASILVIESANIDYLVQATAGKKTAVANLPGNRGMNTWLLVSEQHQINGDSWQIKTAYHTEKSFQYQVNYFSLSDIHASSNWVKKIAQINMQWSASSFAQKQQWATDLRQQIPEERTTHWYTDGLLQLLYMFYELGENTTVLEILDKHSESAKLTREQQWHLQWLRAESHLNSGQFPQAMAAFTALIQSLDEGSDLSEAWRLNLIEIKASAFMAQSLFAFYIQKSALPDNTAIIENLEQAIASGDPVLISAVLYAQAINQVMHDNLTESIALLDLAIELLKDAGALDDLHLFYHQKAVTYYMFNQLDLALLNYRESLALVNEDDDPLYWAGLHVSIAKVYRFLGEYSTAKRYAELAEQHYQHEQLSNELALVQQLLGRLAKDNGMYKAAIGHHQDAMNYFSKHNEKLHIVNMLALAANHQANKQVPAAKDGALLAWLLQVKFLDQHQASTQQGLNSVFSDEFILNISQPLTDKTRDELIFELTQLPLFWNEVTTEAVLILYELTADKRLEQYLQKIMSADSTSDAVAKNTVRSWDVDLQLALFTSLLKIHEIQQDPAAIRQLSARALALINDTHGQFMGTDTALYWTVQAQKFVDSYVVYLLHSGQQEQAFLVLEQQHATNWRKRRFQVEQGKVYQQNSHLYHEYLKVVKEAVLKGQSPARLEDVDIKRELFAHSLQQSNLASVNELADFKPMDTAKLQKQIASDEVAIRYVLNAEPHVFMISKDSWLSQPLPNLSVINELSQKLLHSIQVKDQGYITSAQQLSQALRLNASILEGKNRLIVVTDGVLSAVPFAALSTASTTKNYKPLVMDYDLIQTPSLSTYFEHDFHDKSKEKPKLKTATVVSNPIFVTELIQQAPKASQLRNYDNLTQNLLAGFLKIPQTEREAELIQQQLTGFEVNWLNRADASTANILSQQTRDSDIIHLATHGYFANNSLDHVGLATSVELVDGQINGGFLSLREVFAHTYAAKLVVISGCETIQGTQIDGEGLLGLSHGFLSQGVNAVVASIWAIPDRVTPDFMFEFYQALGDNDQDIPKSLGEAQRQFLQDESHEKYSHPYYWAGFVLTMSN